MKKYYLLAILILAVVLRLVALNQFPLGLNADEAAIGYNAYSLIQTGKDEFGHAWPLSFQSFNDYKPGFYFYLVLSFVKVLGLNIWAVRLPSALLGILSVWLIYLLVKELFKDETWGLLAAFFLAISPWHLHFSRGGWETNTATTLILLGVWLFLKGLKKPKFYLVSVLFFVLSLYTYHSARIIVPLLGLGLIIFSWPDFFQKKSLRFILISGLLGIALLIPLLLSFFGPAGFSRFSGVGLLADTGPLWRVNELRGQHPDWTAPEVRLLHNRLVAYGIALVENWLDHFHGEFLFVSGDVIERSRVPEMGQLYLFQIPLIILGIYFLLKNRLKYRLFILFWLGIAPLAAAMTFQTPHALRAHNMVIPLAIISAYGLLSIFRWVRKKKSLKIILVCLLVPLIGWSLGHYLHQYYVHYPKTYPTAWEQGFDQLVDYLKGKENQYQKIYVTDQYDQPYILFLFYLQYPPTKFQSEAKLAPRDQFGFSTVRDFNNYHFAAIDWESLKDEENVLIVGTDEEIPDSARIIKEIDFTNGQPAFQIVSNKND